MAVNYMELITICSRLSNVPTPGVGRVLAPLLKTLDFSLVGLVSYFHLTNVLKNPDPFKRFARPLTDLYNCFVMDSDLSLIHI